MTRSTRSVPGIRLHQCASEDEQAVWTAARMRRGGTVDDVSLWLAGVERPVRLMGRVRTALRREGLRVVAAMKDVRDAAGDEHRILTWRLEDRTIRPGVD